MLTSSLRPPAGLAARVLAVGNPRSSHYDRVGHLARLGATLFPGPAAWASARLQRPEGLPFRAESVRPVAYGSGATVFRLDGEEGPHVLKVYRRTLGLRVADLVQAAAWYRSKYERVVGWYGDIVLPARYLVVHGPLLGRPGVACVQRYLPGMDRDLLDGRPDEEILAEADADEGLREEVERFVDRTLEIHARERALVDILGPRNLVVVLEEGRPRLRLVDYGVFDLAGPLDRRLRERVEAALRRLENLAARLEGALF
ncbi:MAG: hypothetical protein L0323_01435 [Planctomycetes bacterium]|nr:hypothetical protein [Planctomycetota bacterium]